MVILIAGDVDLPATMRLIEKYYGPWQPGYQPPKMVPEPPQTAPRSARDRLPRPDAADPDDGLQGRRLRSREPRLRGRPALGDLAFGQQSELYKKLVLRGSGSRRSAATFR